MAQVTVQINGRNYQVACGDGEQERISGLAAFVDGKVQELVGSLGNIGDQRLLVMTSLLLADELWEQREGEPPSRPANGNSASTADIEALADRLDRIAARLETF